MIEIEKENLTQEEEKKREHRQQNIYLAKIGLMVFITFVLCILFFFSVLRFEGFANGWSKILTAGQSIIIGLVLAYLLNPVMKFVEGPVNRLLRKKISSEEKAGKISRGIAIAGAILFLLIILILLIAAIVPALISSVSRLVDTLPGNVENFITMIQNGRLGDLMFTEALSDILTKLTEYVEDWVKTLIPQARVYVVQITSSVISVVKSLMNFVVGIIVAAYVLMIKERLIGQSKKVIYSAFKPRQGNIIIEIMHKADEIFGGFIGGKIIDSAIIGIICYLGCSLLRIPDAMLVAVIVGVTNIIPVFGPFIGAVPCLLLVVIQSPWHALYLLIFIIVLQQVDGNIIGPKILGSSTGLSSFWVMFAILVGGGLFGFMGMLLGVPVFAMIYYMVRRLVNHGIKKKRLPVMTEQYVEIAGVDPVSGSFRYYQEEKKDKKAKKEKSDLEKKEDKT